MSHIFTIKLQGSPEELLQRMTSEAKTHGTDFTGNLSSGLFIVHGVHGMYSVVGDEVEITITKKPFLVTLARIEKTVIKLLSNP